jgi:hypothetical protein
VTTIVHQFQPSKRSCGQTVIAMILGVPAHQVIADITDKKGTSAKQLIAYLRARDIWTNDGGRVDERLDGLPRNAILRVIWDEKRHNTHWILRADGVNYDPGNVDGDAYKRNGGRVMSCIRWSRT